MIPKRKCILSFFILLVLYFISACTSQHSDIYNIEDFTTLLMENGNGEVESITRLEPSESLEPLNSYMIIYNSTTLYVEQFVSVDYANAATQRVSFDGRTITQPRSWFWQSHIHRPPFFDTPHYYIVKNLIIIYDGSNDDILNTLTKMGGVQFAGG